MPRDHIDIGPAPAAEDCVPVGSPDYEGLARPECIRFIDLIRRTLGPEPSLASLQVKSNPHDFGAYLSVVCYYYDNDQEATDYAFRCESEAPTAWDTPVPDSNLIAAARSSRVCSSCLGAAAEEGIPDRESQEMLMLEMGADIADHLCDAREAPELNQDCSCACQG